MLVIRELDEIGKIEYELNYDREKLEKLANMPKVMQNCKVFKRYASKLRAHIKVLERKRDEYYSRKNKTAS